MFIFSENPISISDYDHNGNTELAISAENRGDRSNVWRMDLCLENGEVY